MKYTYSPGQFVEKSMNYIIGKLTIRVIELPIIITIGDIIESTSSNEDFIHYLSCYTGDDKKKVKPLPLHFPDDQDRSNTYAELLVQKLNDSLIFKEYKRLKASLTREYGKILIHE